MVARSIGHVGVASGSRRVARYRRPRMDVMVVSPRARTGAVHPRTEPAERHVRALVAAGHRVRWLRPVPEGGSDAPVEGAETVAFHDPVPAFREVYDRFYHVSLETRMCEWLRDDPADVVLVDGYGGVTTSLPPWFARRLGIASVAVAEPIVDIVCHRGTLVDEAGAACDRWDEPGRCLTCCTVPFQGVPTRRTARLARWTRWLGPLAKPPRLSDFENRIDMWVHGLDAADVVLVADEAGRDALERALLPMRAVAVGVPEPEDLPAWTEIYGRAIRAGRQE